MSRIGKKPVIIPKGIKVEQEGSRIKVSGPLGNLHIDCKEGIKIKIDSSAGQVIVENESPERHASRSMPPWKR